MTVPGLPLRAGPRPATSRELPHQQLDQQPTDPAVVERLAQRVDDGVAGVHEEPSGISVPGARALVLDDGVPPGPAEAFLVGREFAHLHPAPDHSLHMALPVDLARRAVESGWAEHHLLVGPGGLPATIVMVYAPRDEAELDVVLALLHASCGFAADVSGTLTHTTP